MIILVRGWDGCGKTILAHQIHKKYPHSEIFTVSVSSESDESHYLLYKTCADDVREYLMQSPRNYAIVDDCGTKQVYLEPFTDLASHMHQSVLQVTPTVVLDVLSNLNSASEADREFVSDMIKYHFKRSRYNDQAISVENLWESSTLPYFNLVFVREDNNSLPVLL